jgi:hypothetical protein
MNQAITPNQMRRLQTLYGQLAAHAQEGADRASRLRWASEQAGRSIASFSELTSQEATRLIDGLQGQLGVKAPAQKRRRLDRDAARRAGTEGRRGDVSNQATMAGAAEFARIQHALDLLGWTQEQLDAWLRSPRSPLGRRASPSIRTLGDANRVWWALKGMLVNRGLWREKTA